MAKKKLSPRRRKGRPGSANSVRIVPVFRDEIDIRKLGRAALWIAMNTARNSENGEILKNNDHEEFNHDEK